MPVLSGVDILKEIKGRNPKTRIYMITGKPFVDRLLGEEGVAGLVSGVIKKPFSIAELLEKIAAPL
jgi:DNA-binding response OmpR family regulator